MENKNNGQGIFYGVIGVATLIVAIIGATFAWFSANAGSGEEEITASSGTVSLKWDDVVTGLKTDLIPVDATNANFNHYPGVTGDDCKDVNGNNICSVYQFTVSNDEGNAAQRIYATLTPKVNTFSNLHFAIFKGNATQVAAATNQFDVDGTEATAFATSETKHDYGSVGDLVHKDTKLTLNSTAAITLPKLEQVLDGGDSVTYTLVLWLQEINADQTEIDGDQDFTAGISFTTGTGSGVTGVLAAG